MLQKKKEKSCPKGTQERRARAATDRQCPHSGVGEDFLTHRFFYEKGRNSETKSRQINPKVRGLQTGR